MKHYAALFILVCLLFTSCGDKQEGEFISPYFEDLGKSKAEIFETYGITEEDTYMGYGTEIGLYLYPKEVTYLGIPHFSVAFHFDIFGEKHELYAFVYYRIYEGDSEELLPLVKELYQKFSEWNPPLKGSTGSSFRYMLEAETLQDLELTAYDDTWPSADEERMTSFMFRKNRNADQWAIAVQYERNYLKDMRIRG